MGPGFGTWIWDLDLGLGFGTGLRLDNILTSKKQRVYALILLDTSSGLLVGPVHLRVSRILIDL